ncbi:MAG: hypothetical protein PHP83_00455 [Clostridia bacterium]|nr:hypothetical protein [Clostridia bacterium]
MSSNLWTLTKVSIKSNFFSNKKLNSKKKISNILLYGILFAYLFGYMFFIAYKMGESFQSINMQSLLLVFAVFSGFAFSLMNSTMLTFGYIFKSKDYELLSSLPIKNNHIFLSKLISAVAIQYLFSFFLYVPFIISYFIFSTVTFSAVIISFFGLLFLPLIPVVLGLIFGLLINLITTRMKYKNIVSIILFLAFLVGVMLISFSSQQIIGYLMTNANNISNVLGSIYLPAKLLSTAILNGNWLFLLYYALINIVPLAVVTLVCAKYFVALNSYFKKSAKSQNFVLKKEKKLTNQVLKKELKRIFSSPNYFMNSCIGPIMLVLFAFVGIFSPSLVNFGDSGILNTVFMMSMFILMCSPLAVTISLEGKSFWVYRSLPLSPRKIFLNKILAQMIIFFPTVVVSCLLFLVQGIEAINFVVILAAGFVLCLLSALIGLTIALKKYNFNYTNEIQIVKQSSAVLIMIVIAIASSVALNTIYYLFSTWCSQLVYVLILIAIWSIICVVLFKKIFSYDHTKFNELN